MSMEINKTLHGVHVGISETKKRSDNNEIIYEVNFNEICMIELTMNQWKDLNDLIEGGMIFIKKMDR